jgi:integrase
MPRRPFRPGFCTSNTGASFKRFKASASGAFSSTNLAGIKETEASRRVHARRFLRVSPYWPEGRRNPISRVKIGEKWSVRPERILTEEETVRVLARLSDPNLLVLETTIATGARISEILGLKWRHVDLQGGVIHIVQRNWRGDIDDPKSKTSKRPLTLGYLIDRFRMKATADSAHPDKWVFVRTDGSGLPLWDSGVRQALKRAAAAEDCDFPGLGPHSFRRANITWRQEVGASSIEASKIAGHSTVRMTEEYTKIQLSRQEELTRRIQERLASVGAKQPTAVQ